MPGAYCHLTLVNCLVNSQSLSRADLPTNAQKALMTHTKYCELGAVSPDYPYMDALSAGSKEWADVQHHKIKGAIKANIIHTGVKALRIMSGVTQARCFAWFCGYVSHIVADVTIHPVVNLKVGYYEEGNQSAHRRMEMHEDVYIYHERYGSEIGISEHVNSQFRGCCDPKSNESLHPDIRGFWAVLLKESYPRIYDETPPQIDKWHRSFLFLIDRVAEEGQTFFLPSRHLEANGLLYPAQGTVDRQYIDDLDTPCGRMNYDAVFDRALGNIGKVWGLLGKAVYADDNDFLTKIDVWDLDLGAKVFNEKVMWEDRT